MNMLLIIVIALVIIYVIKGVIIVQQAEVVVIERLGRFERVLQSGLNFIIPLLEAPRGMNWRVTQKGLDGSTYTFIKERTKIDMREAVYD